MNIRENNTEKYRTQEVMDFSPVEDDGTNFVNGDWCIQRSAKWLEMYKTFIEVEIGDIGHTPWTYGWFRVLDDGGHQMYGQACRALQVCPICYKEWGQSWFANNCDHSDVKLK